MRWTSTFVFVLAALASPAAAESVVEQHVFAAGEHIVVQIGISNDYCGEADILVQIGCENRACSPAPSQPPCNLNAY